ncbi:LOW QUALITY PROTEIN: DNA-binding protein, partial [Streptomyces sp. SPB78]
MHTAPMATGEFGQAVRRWRDRVTPRAAGLPSGGRRRAPGLRREELAQLAGISADYITRLEQGRATHPSAQVVEALARSLRLAPEERAHLYRAAGLVPPGPGTVPGWIPPSVQRLLDRLAGVPVAVFDALWTLLLANGPYEALMGDSSALGSRERNAVWRNFLGSGSRAVMTPAERAAFETGMAADLRAVAQRYPDDPRPAALVAELRAGSPPLRGAVGRGNGRCPRQRAQDHRAPARRRDPPGLRRPDGPRQRPADHGLHGGTGHDGRGAAGARGSTGEPGPGSGV